MRALQVARSAFRVAFSRDRAASLLAETKRLGGIWGKVLQGLSMRYDILPAHVCDMLRVLQTQMDGEPGNYARAVVTNELGSMKAFEAFEDTPVAAATIGQVQKARLVGGQVVAVKVLKPGIREMYALDLRLLTRVAWVIDLMPSFWVLPKMYARDMVKELRAVTTEELDLRFEADHMQRMRSELKRHGLRVPRVHAELSTEQVLVLDWIDGTVMADILKMPNPDRWLRRRDLDGKNIAKTLLRSLCRQVFECNRFHGDMHPGNLIVSRGRVYVIDFGSTNATDRGFLDDFTAFITALSVHDYSRASELYCRLCIWPPKGLFRRGFGFLRGASSASVVRRDLVRALQAWAARAQVKALPFTVKSVNQLTIDLMLVTIKAGGAMQWGWLRLTRAFSTMEATLGVLWPSVDYLKELRRFLRKAYARERLGTINPYAVINALIRLLYRADEHFKIDTTSLRLEAAVSEGL